MSTDKVLLTYKRKRFSSQSDITHDSKATNVSFNNLGEPSRISCPKSIFGGREEKLKNDHLGKWQCLPYNDSYRMNRSLQQTVPAIKRIRKNNIPGETYTGQIVGDSCTMMIREVTENITRVSSSSSADPSCHNERETIQMDDLGRKSGSVYKTCTGGNSTVVLEVEDPINIHVNITNDQRQKRSGCPDLVAAMSITDKCDIVMCDKSNVKESSRTPLITFFRRAKKNQDTSVTSRSLKSLEKQNCSASCSSQAMSLSFTFEGSSQKCIIEEQNNNTPVLLKNAGIPSSHVHVADVEPKGMLIADTNNSQKRPLPCVSNNGNSITGIDVGLSIAPLSVCQKNTEASKQSTDGVPGIQRKSQSLTTPRCPILLTDEENDDRGKELEWLESLDKVLREKSKDRNACSSMQASNIQDMPVGNSNLSNPLPKKLPSENSTNHYFEGGIEKSTPFTDFFGVCHTSTPQLPMDLNSFPASTSSHLANNVYVQDRQLPCSSKANPYFLKQKYVAQNIMADTMMFRGRQCFIPDNLRRFSSEWSEEELDFLWIGVRRHGIENWEAMLRDPKLRFAPSRIPEDLALQWVQEQRKLFNGILHPTPRFSNQNIYSAPFFDGLYASNNPQFAAETRDSLGDVYLHKENFCTSNQSNPSVITSLRLPKHTGSSSTMYHKEHVPYQNFSERSVHQHHPAELPPSTNFPHWLKEVYSVCPRSSDIPWPPFTAAGNAQSSANNDLQLCEQMMASKDIRGRGILKRKSTLSGKKLGTMWIGETSTPIEDSVAGTKPNVVLPTQYLPCEVPESGVEASNLRNICLSNDRISVPNASNDVVVIDSDASSEETISDDQNIRL